ncbi:MAG: DUF4199 domain-containing protein [Bacteroidota bacterium]
MSEPSQDSSSFIKHAAQNGLIMSLVSIVLTMLVYMIDIAIMVEWTFSLFTFLLFAVLTVIFGRAYRNQIGGYLTYGTSFQYAFLVVTVSSLVGLIFNIILFNVIDPDLPQTLARLVMETQEKMLLSFGVSDDIIDETLSNLEQDLPEQYTPIGQLKSSWAILIGAALLAAITAIFIKKKKPDFATDD